MKPIACILLFVLAGIVNARPVQAPTPVQAPPHRSGSPCNVKGCNCGCLEGGPCTCKVKADATEYKVFIKWKRDKEATALHEKYVAEGWAYNAADGYYYRGGLPQQTSPTCQQCTPQSSLAQPTYASPAFSQQGYAQPSYHPPLMSYMPQSTYVPQSQPTYTQPAPTFSQGRFGNGFYQGGGSRSSVSSCGPGG